MPNVGFIREEIKALLPQYNLIRDCVDGEIKVKFKKSKYLPIPNPKDLSPENEARYNSYRERAVFYNVTKRTLAGLCGQVFMREPVIEVPALLDAVIADANGGGVDIVQLAKRALQYIIAFGRCGVLTDYPETEGFATRAELEKGDIRPTINVYPPWDVINWRTIQRGAKVLLSLVVLQEQYILKDDGFEMKKADQWRVLRLNESGFYVVEIWRKETAIFSIYSSSIPLDSNGQPLTEIPFIIIGAENNDEQPDNPPLYDLASLNIAHYRNSADYEESCFITGQPTPFFSGLTEEWVKEVLGGGIMLGARAAVPLPEGGDAGLLQAAPNSQPFEAMEHKERQMVALGAKLVEQKQVQRTATEATIENTSENSTLTSSAKNVSAGFKFALEKCLVFVGSPETEIKFELNTEFDISKMTPDERRQLVAEWQGGAITFEEMRDKLRKSGIATLDDAEAKETIARELMTAPNMEGDKKGNEGWKKNNTNV